MKEVHHYYSVGEEEASLVLLETYPVYSKSWYQAAHGTQVDQTGCVDDYAALPHH